MYHLGVLSQYAGRILQGAAEAAARYAKNVPLAGAMQPAINTPPALPNFITGQPLEERVLKPTNGHHGHSQRIPFHRGVRPETRKPYSHPDTNSSGPHIRPRQEYIHHAGNR